MKKQKSNTQEMIRQVGKRIRLQRFRLGWTQDNLEQESGISAAHIGKLECGKYNMRTSTLQTLANAMNVDIRAFFTDEEELVPRRTLLDTPALLARVPEQSLNRLLNDVVDMIKIGEVE